MLKEWMIHAIAGRKIQAIKVHRLAQPSELRSLKSSKETVEAFMYALDGVEMSEETAVMVSNILEPKVYHDRA